MKPNECCRYCGISKDRAEEFYTCVGKEPFADQIYFCNECYKVLKVRKWMQGRKVEKIK